MNKYGFIESPYRKVKDGAVTNEVVYLSAMEEAKHYVAQSNAVYDDEGRFTEELITCRHAGENMMVPSDKVDLMDVRRNSSCPSRPRSFRSLRTMTPTAH